MELRLLPGLPLWQTKSNTAGGIRRAAVPTLFSVVAGVDDILLDEGTGYGQRERLRPSGGGALG